MISCLLKAHANLSMRYFSSTFVVNCNSPKPKSHENKTYTYTTKRNGKFRINEEKELWTCKNNRKLMWRFHSFSHSKKKCSKIDVNTLFSNYTFYGRRWCAASTFSIFVFENILKQTIEQQSINSHSSFDSLCFHHIKTMK